QICDDLLNSLPKLHAALRSNPSRNEQLWRRTSSVNARVNTFELVGMPPNDGGADGTEVNYAVAASTKLKCHLNEVLNVLVSQKTSDYEATMQALSEHKYQSSSLKTADLVRDYRYTFDAIQTTYEGHPLPPTPSPAREARRLHHIHASGILEPEYDHSALDLLAQVAAKRLNCPIGFVSLVDENVFHSVGTYPPRTFGLQTSRTESMCAHTVYVDKPLVIKNAQCDLRFAQLPVVRDHGIRFYAGFPIRAPDGSISSRSSTESSAEHSVPAKSSFQLELQNEAQNAQS
ncbi:hypothetical protein JG688_00014252, partial [Phytophthora aleatoria]